MKLQNKIVFVIALVALFGTVTNYVYLSPLLTLLVPLSIFMVNKEQMLRPVAWLYLFTGLFLLSAFIYDPNALINFGFYRRDGNFIISYAPLFVLPLFSFAVDLKKYFRVFYLFAMGLYGLLFFWHVWTIGRASTFHDYVFGGLFFAQNAVGAFLSVLGALGFAYAWNRNQKREWLFFGIILLVLLATYSRGSVLGLVLGIGAWFLTIRKYYKTLLLYMLVPVLFTVGSLMVGYPYYKKQIATNNYVAEYTGENTSGKSANVLIRLLYTFPRAYYAFTKSPVVGTGVGSFDDRPYRFQEVVPLVQYNAQPKKLHTDSHAHHSYLHILAEQGIIGLGLFLVFWVSVFWYLVRMRGQPVLRDFLLIAYFTITIASFTEHRITQPTQVLPFTIPLGLVIASREQSRMYVIEKVE